MKKIIKWISLIVIITIILILTIIVVDYYSVPSKNTREIERILSQDITSGKDRTSGNVKDLIRLDYDKMFVFEAYQSIEEMEKQLGFKYPKLQEGVNEGMINILFTKNNSTVAYLYGYPDNTGYNINIPIGEYTKAQIDKMTYTVEEKEFVNSAGAATKYMDYKFF